MNENLVSLYQYAKLCDLSLQAILYRVKKGKIIAVKKTVDQLFIDIDAFPPIEKKKRKSYTKKV